MIKVINEPVKCTNCIYSKMNDSETLTSCAMLMARIFCKQAKNMGGTNIDFEVNNISDKKTKEKFGHIKVEWKYE